MKNATIVTALYDMDRDKEGGDGRTINEYFEWLKITLCLKANFVVFMHDKLYHQYKELLNTIIDNDRIFTYITTIEDIPYYKYKDSVDLILKSDEYKKTISAPERIECKLSMYNIIQYSKLEWIKHASMDNPHNSEYFFWMDAGLSRFFEDVNINNKYPDISKLSDNQILVQGRRDIFDYKNWDNLHVDCVNLICGGMFGGSKTSMLWLCEKVKELFEDWLQINVVNNEQLVLALIWKHNQDRFKLYVNNTNRTFPLFKYLAQD